MSSFTTSAVGDIPVSCDEYISTAVEAVQSAAMVDYRHRYMQVGDGNSTGNWSQPFSSVKGGATSIDDTLATIYHVAVSVVSIFGIAGNVLNLIVLTRRRLQRSMDGLERSVRLGLVALAVSDTMFCALYCLSKLLPVKGKYSPYDSLFGLYFHVYHEGLINVFQVTSTWLTVNVALGRYVAICHPLHARGYIRPRGTRIAVGAIILASALFNAPRFAKYTVMWTACDELLGLPFSAAAAAENVTLGVITDSAAEASDVISQALAAPPTDCSCYYFWKDTGWMYQSATFRSVYSLMCLLIEILLPLMILSVCNVCLIRALRRSYRMQSLYRTNQKPIDSAHRITPTLISLIVLFTLFVTPSYLLDFVVRMTGGSVNYRAFKIATMVTNFLLLVNFSVNFILYLVINVEFRRATRDLVTCQDTGDASEASMSATHQTSVSVGNSYRLVGQSAVGSSHNDGISAGSNRRHVSETILSD